MILFLNFRKLPYRKVRVSAFTKMITLLLLWFDKGSEKGKIEFEKSGARFLKSSITFQAR